MMVALCHELDRTVALHLVDLSGRCVVELVVAVVVVAEAVVELHCGDSPNGLVADSVTASMDTCRSSIDRSLPMHHVQRPLVNLCTERTVHPCLVRCSTLSV